MRDVALTIELLLCKHEALSTNSSFTKKKKKKRKKVTKTPKKVVGSQISPKIKAIP
jgi:hypothetical protein